MLVLTLDEVIDRLNEIRCVTEEDGMPAECAVNFDHISLGQRDRFGAVLCTLTDQRWPEVRTALLAACGFDQ